MINRKGRTGRRRLKKHNAATGWNSSADRTYSKLLQWMKQKYNFKAKVLKVSSFPGIGRGILARKTISTGSLIISVPKHALIGVKQACSDSFLIKSLMLLHEQDKTTTITGTQALCVFLIEEQRKLTLYPDEKWNTYIKVLPKDFLHPLYWKMSTLSLLPQDLYQKGIKQRNEVKQQLKTLNKFIQLGVQQGSLRKVCNDQQIFKELKSIISMEEYRWAWCCVNTRCVYSGHNKLSGTFVQQTKADNYYLIPFLDLLNHSANAQVRGEYNWDTKQFEITALTDCKKHKQVFIHYGAHSNATLLMEYGFVATNEENMNDVIPVAWEDLVQLYNFDEAQQLEIKSVLGNFFIDEGWCYSRDGPSWSLIATISLMEDINTNPALLFQRSYFHELAYSLMKEDSEISQEKAYQPLRLLSKKKVDFINEKTLKCITKKDSANGVEAQHIQVVLNLWNLYLDIMNQNLNKVYS